MKIKASFAETKTSIGAKLTSANETLSADFGEVQVVPGADGISPTVDIEPIDGGHRISITDKDGTQTADVMDGRDGADGYTPVKNVDYFDGQDGRDGDPGADGISPTVAVQDITGGHRVTITDKDGAKTFDVMDGKDGKDGAGGSGGGASVQSDWSVNDENDPAYVKNRPFYKYNRISPRIDFIDGVYTSESFPDLGGAYAAFVDTAYKENIAFGRAYTVIYNGIEYEGLVEYSGVIPQHVCYGNLSIVNAFFGTDYEDTGEPFIVAVANAGTFLISDFTQPTTDSWEMYASPINNEIIVTIDPKYIPFGGVGTGVGAEIFNSDSNIASGTYSHAEGVSDANGDYSHAEGHFTIANGKRSHAEGERTRADGASSHAEGRSTITKGRYSHAEGYSTIANGDAQHVEGELNIEDEANYESRGAYVHVVGNGTDDAGRSNAHTLDWDGNAWFSGSVYVGSTSGVNRDEGSMKLVANGDSEIILTSPSGTRYRLTVADDGTLTTATV